MLRTQDKGLVAAYKKHEQGLGRQCSQGVSGHGNEKQDNLGVCQKQKQERHQG